MKKLTMNSKEKIEAVLALENADRDPLALAVKYISEGYEEFKSKNKLWKNQKNII